MNAEGIGTVTQEMLWQRAVELKKIYGHTSEEVTESDLDLARRDLLGEEAESEAESAIELAPESERWDPIYSSTGGPIKEIPSEDVDEEGHSDSARLVEEGIREAEHDQMLQAVKLRNS